MTRLCSILIIPMILEFRGKNRSDSLIATLRAHAPEWVYVPSTKAWYITTCGWKWVATLTNGEVAIAPVMWQKVK